MRTFARVVEDYLGNLRRIRVSGGATGERSGYGPLANLLNEIGGGLKPKVFCVGELANHGPGISTLCCTPRKMCIVEVSYQTTFLPNLPQGNPCELLTEGTWWTEQSVHSQSECSKWGNPLSQTEDLSRLHGTMLEVHSTTLKSL